MLVKINWKPTPIDLKKFGLTLLVGFGLMGGLVFWRGGHATAIWMWGISSAVAALSLLLPRAALPFYVVWMGIALVMGTLVSTLILVVIFYLIITPVGLFMRLMGRDALRLKRKSFKGDTYWIDHPALEDNNYYERLF